ncbi:MAG: class I SAM-dependent DNA methyltransferase [Janthinobacterium lividum]
MPEDLETVSSFGPVTPFYDTLMSAVPYRFWMDYLAKVWRKHGQQPKTILDLACGTGTMSRLLVTRGFVPTGVDLSAGMLEVARSQAQEAGLTIPFIQQDAADLDLSEARFDAAICLFDSLNYILEPERLQSAFARVCAHLEPGGSFFFDVNTEYALAEGMFNQSCTRRDEPLHYRWRSRYDPETRLCTIRMNFSFDEGEGVRRTFTEVHRQRAYSKEELTQWLRDAGFAEVTIYDAYSIDPPKKRSDRLFYFAAKPRD